MRLVFRTFITVLANVEPCIYYMLVLRETDLLLTPDISIHKQTSATFALIRNCPLFELRSVYYVLVRT